MTTKLFERLVTKFSIKVNDLAKYLEISKATIYNYRNLDDFGDIQWIEEDASSVCQMLIELVYDTRLKMCPEGAKKLFMGVVSDTNRFLFDYTSPKTFSLISKLIEDNNIEMKPLYDNLYKITFNDLTNTTYYFIVN